MINAFSCKIVNMSGKILFLNLRNEFLCRLVKLCIMFFHISRISRHSDLFNLQNKIVSSQFYDSIFTRLCLKIYPKLSGKNNIIFYLCRNHCYGKLIDMPLTFILQHLFFAHKKLSREFGSNTKW